MLGPAMIGLLSDGVVLAEEWVPMEEEATTGRTSKLFPAASSGFSCDSV